MVSHVPRSMAGMQAWHCFLSISITKHNFSSAMYSFTNSTPSLGLAEQRSAGQPHHQLRGRQIIVCNDQEKPTNEYYCNNFSNYFISFSFFCRLYQSFLLPNAQFSLTIDIFANSSNIDLISCGNIVLS